MKQRLYGAAPRHCLRNVAAMLGAALLWGAALLPDVTRTLDAAPVTAATTAATQAEMTVATDTGAGSDAGIRPLAGTSLPSAQQPVSRVITLAPHITELVFAAGAGDKIVATVNSSNYPPAALTIPRIGDGLSINAERLLTLQPDLLIGWQNTLAMQKLTPLLTGLDISVVYSKPRQLDDITADIQRLGNMLGTTATAGTKASELRKRLSALRDTYARLAPVSVFIEVGTGPLYTLGNDTLTNDAVSSCGGVNVFGDAALVAPSVTVESVLAHNPDVIIIASATPRRVVQRTAYWKRLQLPAAQQDRVHGIDPDMLLRPGPRLIDATQKLCQYLDRARSPD